MKAYEVSPNKIITVSGTITESTDPSFKEPRDHYHEEADTLIVFHCLEAAEDNPGCKINVHSIDTDVYLLLLSVAHEIKTDRLYMMVGRGTTKREIDIIQHAMLL